MNWYELLHNVEEIMKDLANNHPVRAWVKCEDLERKCHEEIAKQKQGN